MMLMLMLMVTRAAATANDHDNGEHDIVEHDDVDSRYMSLQERFPVEGDVMQASSFEMTEKADDDAAQLLERETAGHHRANGDDPLSSNALACISTSTVTVMVAPSQHEPSIDPLTGLVINAVSSVTGASVDMENGIPTKYHPENKPFINMYGSAGDEAASVTSFQTDHRLPQALVSGSDAAHAVVSSSILEEDRSITSADMVPSCIAIVDVPRRRRVVRKKNDTIVSTVGDQVFAERYDARPADDVVVLCALISGHCDISMREHEMAERWLAYWYDGSKEFAALKKKGLDLAGM